MRTLRISEIVTDALQRRWRRNANLNELAALDASGLADIGLDKTARNAILGRAVSTPPRL